jgi:integrase
MTGRLRSAASILGFDNPQTVPWHEIRFQHVAALVTALQERDLSPATVNATLYAIRGVVRACFNLGLIGSNDYEKIKSVRPIKYTRLLSGRAIQSGELLALIKTCVGRPIDVRDAAIIALLYAGGLRRAEIVSLNLEDYSGEAVRVKGKGNKERLVPVNNGTTDAINDWIEIRGSDPGPLFHPINKGGSITRSRISKSTIFKILKSRAEKAGIKTLSPHDLRRSCTTDLLELGVDVFIVGKVLGHASIQTTLRYDHRDEKAKRRAIGLLHVPYIKAH